MPNIRTSIFFRELDTDELIRISEIDRSEDITEKYMVENGQWKKQKCRISSPGFDPAELRQMIHRQEKILEENGYVVGAFDKDRLVGVASLENKKRGIKQNYRKMDILYVSRTHRGIGIGAILLKSCKEKAHELGGQKLYISATPTKGSIDFYLKHGATLTHEIDGALFQLEPEDIHLEVRT